MPENNKNFKSIRRKYEQDPSENYLKLLVIGAVVFIVFLFIVIIVYFSILKKSPGKTVTPTAVPVVLITNEATKTISPTKTPLPTNTLEPTATLFPQNTATKMASPSPTITLQPTTTPELSLTPSPTPYIISAICICDPQNAAFFGSPRVGSQQIGIYTTPGEEVTVLGRNETGHWLFVENQDGEKGWVTTSYFNVSQPIDSIEIVDVIVTREGPSATPVSTLTSPSTLMIAYWQETAIESTNDGKWKAILAIRVPTSGNYEFDIDNLVITWTGPKALDNGYVQYDVSIAGMSCEGPLVQELRVFRDKTKMEVQNEHTKETGSIFVSSPGCD